MGHDGTFNITDPRFRRSDYVPTDTERSKLTEILKQETINIECFNEELLRHAEDTVVIQRKSSETTASTCRSALSAHRRLPTEVWDIVFSTLCLALHQYTFQIEYIDEETFPALRTPAFILSQVCSRWRAIVSNSPRLWSSYSIDVDSTAHIPDISSLLGLYFANAGDYPPSVRIARDRESPALSEGESVTWEVLLQYLPRCKELSLRIDGYALVDFSGISFPNLECFCTELDMSGSNTENEIQFWNPIRAAPNLRKVTLWQLPDFGGLPFHQLTELDLHLIDGFDVDVVLEHLPSCKSLERLSFWGLDDYHLSDLMDVGRVDVPLSLTTLSIHDAAEWVRLEHQPGDQNFNLTTLLTSLYIPSLVSLDLSCREWPSLLLTMVARSPLLEKVTLTIRRPPQTDTVSAYPVISIMRSLPRLTHFELRMGPMRTQTHTHLGRDILSTVLSSLVVDPSPTSPKLEHLSFRLSDITLDSELIEGVLERIQTVMESSRPRPLKGFSLYRIYTKDSPEVEFELEDALRERMWDLERRFGFGMVVGECDWKDYLLRGCFL
ncbi:hypothetical protein V5O48_016969 [Marasmius crinis-equi]|uniref:F-box domain-containing protein n=1 Tax=Marasmius crinis-equi TaxID=585013 RepID=A0ABR3EQ95_9AGAR